MGQRADAPTSSRPHAFVTRVTKPVCRRLAISCRVARWESEIGCESEGFRVDL